MSAGAPWSVKGIDPKAREVAKDLARRSGMTLGELLNQLILDGDDPALAAVAASVANEPGDDALAPAALSSAPFSNPGFSSAAYAPPPREPYREEPRSVLDAPSRYRVPEHPADEVGRVTAALERLSERIEAAERRSALAISGIDESVRGVIGRIDNAEREQVAVAARFEGVVDDIKSEQTRTTDRLQRVEAEAHGPRSAEALKALEQALGKVAGHLYEGEAKTRQIVADVEARVARVEAEGAGAGAAAPLDTNEIVEAVVGRIGQRLETAEARTAEAIETLGASFSALDGRLNAVEQGGGAAERRLEELAANLSRRMEAARVEMAQKIRETAEGRFDRIDSRLAEMSAHVAAAEHRSAQAIEHMGREVVNLADTMGRRVTASETRSAAVIEQVGGEVARIASAMEARVGRADTAQAQALEKLGGEIARITERLAERIANAERRNALAIDDVGEQMARVTERITQRNERANSDLVERIRQSEERTARLLDEARERIDQGLAGAQRKLAESVAPVVAAPPPVMAPQAPASPFHREQFSPFAAQTIPEDTFAAPAYEPAYEAPSAFDTAEFPVAEPETLALSDDDFDAADEFTTSSDFDAAKDEFAVAEEEFRPAATLTETVHDASAEPWQDEPPAPPAAEAGGFDFGALERPLSTREIIEQARAQARATQAQDRKGKKLKPAKPEKAGKAPKTEKGDKLTPLSEVSGGGGRSLFGLGKKAREPAGVGLQRALAVAAVAATLSGGYALYSIKSGSPEGDLPSRVMQARNGKDAPVGGPEADTTPEARAQAAVAPPAATPAGVDPVATPDQTATATALFVDAKARIEAKDRTGLEGVRRAANLGYTPAQFYLAKLYENGEVGLKKNPVEARQWTERAAQGGDRGAMHNLALAYYQGAGGPKNPTIAATWFRKAADLGLVDSQFNLAQLYEVGAGVEANAAEAYKWYLIAARAGDADSKAASLRLKSTLSAEAQTTAERSAFAFRAATPNGASTTRVAALSSNVGVAQRALNRLGYYQGPTDGSPSPALGMAISAYQRDQNLKVTGALDPDTAAKLAVFGR